MTLKRFEILLPLNYNDGRPIEREKFLATHRELVSKFRAATVDVIQASGSWVYRGTFYEDLLIRGFPPHPNKSWRLPCRQGSIAGIL